MTTYMSQNTSLMQNERDRLFASYLTEDSDKAYSQYMQACDMLTMHGDQELAFECLRQASQAFLKFNG